MTKAKPAAGACICGSSFELPAASALTPQARADYEASFWRSHRGKGHGPKDAEPAPPEPEKPADQGGLF